MKNKRNKAFILGIDGATFNIINPLMEKGKLPNMQEVVQNGVHGNLLSTIPSISAPAWVAFMTGKNPGHYGTYHFRKIDIRDYRNIFSQDLINSSMFSGDTFFDYLGESGYRVGVMTIPVTYPPWKVNGFMVSGYPCPDPDGNANFTFPSSLSKSLLQNLNWTETDSSNSIPKEETRGARDPQDILNGGLTMMSRRTEHTLKLMDSFDCDVTALVWGAIDRAQHILWKFHDPGHILHQAGNPCNDYIQRLYCHADKLLGDIMAHLGPENHLFIVSDHGFGPKQGCRFNLNSWLNQHGYLKPTLKARLMNNPLINTLKGQAIRFASGLNTRGQKKMMQIKQTFGGGGIDFSETAAYMFPIDEETEGLVINMKGRQPSGIVAEDKYESIRTEIMGKLREIKDPRNGRGIIKECYKREELYNGSRVDETPDIIIVLEESYYPGARATGRIITEIPAASFDINSGTHRREGIFMACGPDILSGMLQEDAGIMDIAPTLLYALGEKIPNKMEGKVLKSVFSADRLKQVPVFIDRKTVAGVDSIDLSVTEQESMKNRLRDLGYL